MKVYDEKTINVKKYNKLKYKNKEALIHLLHTIKPYIEIRPYIGVSVLRILDISHLQAILCKK